MVYLFITTIIMENIPIAGIAHWLAASSILSLDSSTHTTLWCESSNKSGVSSSLALSPSLPSIVLVSNSPSSLISTSSRIVAGMEMFWISHFWNDWSAAAFLAISVFLYLDHSTFEHFLSVRKTLREKNRLWSKKSPKDLKSCFGVSVAVSAWSAGVGQHRKGLQMEKTPSLQKAYRVKRMKTARGTKEYITSFFSLLRSSSVMAMLGSRCETQHGYLAPTSPNCVKKSANAEWICEAWLNIQIYLRTLAGEDNHILSHLGRGGQVGTLRGPWRGLRMLRNPMVEESGGTLGPEWSLLEPASTCRPLLCSHGDKRTKCSWLCLSGTHCNIR